MRPRCGDRKAGGEPGRIPRLDRNDQGRVSDVHVEAAGGGIEERPSGPAGDACARDRGFFRSVDDCDRMGLRPGGIADVRGEENSTHRLERESVGADADRDLHEFFLPPLGKDAHDVLAAVRGEYEVSLVGDQDSRHLPQPGDGFQKSIPSDVDDVHGIVGGVGDKETARCPVHGRMVKPSIPDVRRQVDVANGFQAHPGAASRIALARIPPRPRSPPARKGCPSPGSRKRRYSAVPSLRGNGGRARGRT